MAFLVPIIIIKCLGLGPKAFLSPDELEELCEKIDTAETKGLQQEANAALQTLTRVHNALALLQAAINPTAPDPSGNKPGDGNVVAAYAMGESKSFEEAIGKVEATQTTTKGRNLTNKVTQMVLFPGMADSAPLLELFLKRFQEHGAAADFDRETCLNTCRQAVLQADANPRAPLYTAKAFNLLRLLWRLNVSRNLTEVCELGDQIGDLAETEKWLEETLQLDALKPWIDNAYTTNDKETKLALSRIATLLDINCETFSSVYGRFMDGSNGLEATIMNFAEANDIGEIPEHWKNLLSASYGAIAWQIFQQAHLAVDETWMVVKGL